VEALTPGRYRFHDLLRLFARERAEAEESADTRRVAVAAGVDWYLARMLEAAVLLGPARSVDRTPVFTGLAEALAWLDMERENLVRAVMAAGEHDLVAPCWQMADALFRFYDLRRYLTDWQQVNEVALHAAERAGLHEVEGRMHNGIGYVFAQQARFDQALMHLEAALAIRREVGDAAGEGRTLKNLGDIRIQLGRPHEALGSYEQALTLSRAVGDRHRQGQALHGVGVALTAMGRLPEAEQCLEEALSIRLEVGDEPGEARTRLWLGNVRRDQGWYAKARAEYEGSLTILRRVGDRYHEGIALWQMGVAAQQQGEFEPAQATWRHALSLLETLGCTEAEEVRGLLVHEPAGSASATAQTE
jgi:tetratricopeptide (TPR) repeat protein